MAYQGFYIKKTAEGKTAVDVSSVYSVYAQEIPFHIIGKTKELASNNWYDEDGEDVYIPSTIKSESYEMSCKFVCKALRNEAASKVKAFIDFLRGTDGCAEFSIYDPYYKIGRQGCYLLEVDESADVLSSKEGDNEYLIVSFGVKIKVCDPITNVILA